MKLPLHFCLVSALALSGCGESPSEKVDTTLPDQSTLKSPSPAAERSEAAIEQTLSISLDDAIEFSDPANCEPSPALARVFDRVLAYDESSGRYQTGGNITLAGISAAMSPSLKVTQQNSDGLRMTEYESSVRIPPGGRWHGLKMSRIVVSHLDVEDSDDSDVRSINFLESPETVRRVLNKRGFGIPAPPDYRQLEDGVCGGSMQVVAIPGGAALQCGYGC